MTGVAAVARARRVDAGVVQLQALVRAVRPRQWSKNVLVLGAPLTGGALADPQLAGRALLAFASLCLVSSAVYLLNDVLDRDEDRRHPRKRTRPVASGELPVPTAVLASGILCVAGFAVAFAVTPGLGGVVGAYVVLSLAYVLRLRNEVVLDIGCVAAGFLLRAVAGGVAVDTPLSSWFLIVTAFGSLFLVAAKRHADLLELGTDSGASRRALDGYSSAFLLHVKTSASTVAIAAYCLWAFESPYANEPWSGLSIAPFVLAVFRYALLLDRGAGGAPEDVLLRDRTLLVLGGVWVLLVAVGRYAG